MNRLTGSWWWRLNYKGGLTWTSIAGVIFAGHAVSQMWQQGVASFWSGHTPLIIAALCLLLGIFERLCLLTAQMHELVVLKQIMCDDTENGGMRWDAYERLKTLLRKP